MITKKDIRKAYQRHADKYDLSVQLYRLLGLRIEAYRSYTVDLLSLQKGDWVVELGCGTGLNFPRIMEKIGPGGRLIGVDITPGMLDVARAKADRCGWQNVELIESDIAAFHFPPKVNGVISTGVFGYVPEYDCVIEKASRALAPGGLLVIFDLKRPERWPSWLFHLYLGLAQPFGVTPAYFHHKPWKSVERHFPATRFEERYGGLIYISTGIAGIPTAGEIIEEMANLEMFPVPSPS
ncbi:MAG: methyltransferase domain-containing protein [Nitrospinota bacterium]|nr:methyltransferase domain-containing protein [Nitrospinota bacterium]